MNRKRVNALIEKYLNGTSSCEENEWLDKWLDSRSEVSEWSWKDDKYKKEIQWDIFNKIDDEIIKRLPIQDKKEDL